MKSWATTGKGYPDNGHRYFRLDRHPLYEPETEPFAKAIAANPKRLISVFNLLETAIVIEAKKGEAGGRELDLLLHRTQIEAVPLTPEQAEMARTAWRR